MSLRLTNAAAEFFSHIGQTPITGVRFMDIDKYYACLMLGLRDGTLGPTDDFRDSFLAAGAGYPDAYKPNGDYLAGLLVEAEIRRLEIDPTDRDVIETETVKLLNPRSPLGLSEKGLELLNRYAARGFEQLQTHMSAPRSLEVFLMKYAEIWHELDGH